MATPTVEQYVKTIYQLAEGVEGSEIGMKRLADAMGVTPGTATSMAKHLASRGHIIYVPRKGVVLTHDGTKLALRIVRRHRLIESFLEKFLSYDWTEVHAEAEKLEHAVSDLFVERIDELLGRPTVDPHGDPIPDVDGVISARDNRPLSQSRIGDVVMIDRLTNHESRFLSSMNAVDIRPGNTFTVTGRDDALGTIELSPGSGASISIGTNVAHAVLIHLRS